jgi:hypothetical protein
MVLLIASNKALLLVPTRGVSSYRQRYQLRYPSLLPKNILNLLFSLYEPLSF